MRSAVYLTQENARTALNTVKATGSLQGMGDFAYDTAVATAVLVYDTSLAGLFDEAARARNAARSGALIELAANIDELPAAIAASVETRMAEAARLSEAGDIRGANRVMGELSAEIGSFLLPGAGAAGVAGGVAAKSGAKAVADLSPKTQALLAKLSGGEMVDGSKLSINDAWSLDPVTRGVFIEKSLAATDYKDWYNVSQEMNGFFPLVDFQKGDTLVSVKSVDTRGAGWQARMAKHIEDLGTRNATVDGRPANMILDIRVQPGGKAVAESLVDIGIRSNVTVQITEFK